MHVGSIRNNFNDVQKMASTLSKFVSRMNNTYVIVDRWNMNRYELKKRQLY